MAAGMKQSIDDWKSKLDTKLHEKNKFTDLLAQAEAKSGVKRLNIVLAIIGLLGVYLMVGYGADFLCNFIGFIYPAYASIKAIESPQKEDDTKWLTYWVVYSTFHLCELFTDIFFSWIPLYWFLKCVFLVFCFAPIDNNGSVMLYHKIIRPYILKHESKIDAGIDKAKNAARTLFNEAEGVAKDTASDVRRFAGDNKSD